MNTRKAIPDRFQGKVALVTGGSSGIGRAIVEELCKEGASVAFTGISEIGVQTNAELREAGFNVLFCRGDMVDEKFCWSSVDQTVKAFGRIDYLVNNAFSFIAKGMDATTEDWVRSYTVGPIGYARMVQNVVPFMKQVGGGAIVNMSSISAFQAQLICRRRPLGRPRSSGIGVSTTNLSLGRATAVRPWSVPMTRQ